MYSTKLIHQLSLLNKKDIKSFLRFVQSPYHNTVKLLPSLLEEIMKYYPDFKHPNLEVEKVYERIHPKGKAWNEGRMNLLMTQLTALLDDFRTFEVFKKDQLNFQKAKMQSYQDYQLDRSFFRATKKHQELLEKLPKDEKYFLESFLHQERVYQHPKAGNYDGNFSAFQQCLTFLNKSFLWHSIVYALRAKNRSRVLNLEANLPLLEPVLDNFQQEIESDPVLLFHKKLLNLQYNEKESLLLELIPTYQALIASLTHQQAASSMLILLNVGMGKLRGGKTYLRPYLFQLYEIGEKNDLLISNHKMKGVTFTNVASIAAACGYFDWLDFFLVKYKGKIVEAEREDALNLSMAYYYYHKAIYSKEKADFEQVIKYLTGIQFKGKFIFYRVKTLLLRAHYEYFVSERRGSEFVINQITAFEQQLRRKKDSIGSKFTSFMGFTRTLKKLVEIRCELKFSKTKVTNLFEEVSANEQLFAKVWLLEKIGEL